MTTDTQTTPQTFQDFMDLERARNLAAHPEIANNPNIVPTMIGSPYRIQAREAAMRDDAGYRAYVEHAQSCEFYPMDYNTWLSK